ncbi:MAG: hypothetical protein IJN43_04215, partial [Ruminococcus sp.]|nr:hypothetical protein [Ruminococcus sp.]
EHNTYYLEEKIFTQEETEIIEFSEFYDDEYEETETLEIGYITSDNEIIIPPPDLMEDIPDEICDRLKDFVGVYAA